MPIMYSIYGTEKKWTNINWCKVEKSKPDKFPKEKKKGFLAKLWDILKEKR